MKPSIDLSLYHVTDAPLSAGRGLIDTVMLAVKGGATLIQLRDPQAKAGVLLEQARALAAILKPTGIPLIINDRPDVAHAAGAAGVHVGQGDLPPEAARAILGPDAIIGLSITHASQMAAIDWRIVDHVGVGPVISKGVKQDAEEPMGIEGLAACVRLARGPVVAIGGIGLHNVADCIRAGAAGVAVVAAIAGANDPEAATRDLKERIAAARGAHS